MKVLTLTLAAELAVSLAPGGTWCCLAAVATDACGLHCGGRPSTADIQREIDAKSAAGGGTVTVPAGTYEVGSIWLKDNVTLNLARGATLLGSTNCLDYVQFSEVAPHVTECLIKPGAQSGLRQMRAVVSAYNVTNAALVGEGKIDGRGWFAYDVGLRNSSPNRWRDVAFFRCRNVRVEGVTLVNAASWTLFFRECRGVVARGLHIDAHANFNNDGIDIDAKDVLVEDCTIDSDDDALCLKSHNPDFVVENVEVRNCRIASNCNHIKLGTAGYGGFRNVRIHDCTLVPCRVSKFRFWPEQRRKSPEGKVPDSTAALLTDPISSHAGIALECVDGGRLEDVRVSGIDFSAGGVQVPIFVRLARRNVRPDGRPAVLRNVVIENVRGRSVSTVASSVTGVPGLRPSDIVLRDIDLRTKAGGRLADLPKTIPEAEKSYPESDVFHTILPASGFYLRHCDGVRFENVRVTPDGGGEERPTIVAEDCTGVVEDWETRRSAAVSRPRPLVYNTDGCDMLYWPSNLPVSVGNFTSRRLRHALDSHVSTVSYCPQSAGFGHFCCRKAGEPLLGSVPRVGYYNAAGDFFALGTDALQMAMDFCATNALERFVSVRVNDQHDGASTTNNVLALYPQFKIDHPECLMGSLDRTRNADLYHGYAGWSCVNFDCELVRETMKRFVRELVSNYDVDGIEYDFNRHFMLFRSVATGGVATAEEVAKTTQLMRDLKAITEEVGKARGRPIVIAVRLPDSVEFDLAVGADLVTWFREKLVDIWIGGGYFLLNPLEKSVELAHRHGIRFYWSLDDSRIQDLAVRRGNPFIPGRGSEAFYVARYAAAQAAGCDGVYLFNREGEGLRQVVTIDPRNTVGRTRIYFATERGSGGYGPNNWVRNGRRFSHMPDIDPNAPHELEAGASYAFKMFLGEDFAAAAQRGLVPTVELLALSDATEPLAVRLNGAQLTATSFAKGLQRFPVSAALVKRGTNTLVVSTKGKNHVRDFAIRIAW